MLFQIMTVVALAFTSSLPMLTPDTIDWNAIGNVYEKRGRFYERVRTKSL